ncbi:uncharacterized protein PFLUO_LOCUS1373 [Penicillium psychrofluorescens]|uniref:uncharacterized protein n=1 Tax=Penicillium psychrofluorescens TaxID=3158075 RepID=UPI003CCC9E09
MSVCILLRALADIKESWNNPGTLFGVIEETERRCFEEIKACKIFLETLSGLFEAEEIVAAQSLLEFRFNSVIARIWGLGLLHAAVLRARSREGRVTWERKIESHEAVQISEQVMNSRADVLTGAAEPFAMVLARLGARYPEMLGSLLELFIECTNLKLGGITFRPPFQHLALEILTHCKNLLENNIVHVKCFGQLNPKFEKQLELFTICARRFDSMVAAPCSTTDTAFAHGCIYAAVSKVITGFCGLMRGLKEQVLAKKWKQEGQDTYEEPMGLEFFNLYTDLNDPFIIGSNTSTEAWDMWPYVRGFDTLATPQELFDYIEALNTGVELGRV